MLQKNIRYTATVRISLLALTSLATSIYGYPTSRIFSEEDEIEPDFNDYMSFKFWEKIIVVVALVLLGGVFAGMHDRLPEIISLLGY